ncbi:MAG: cell division protein ZapA [candidate division WOR-3 bacterium]|nr:cell division protein ZapA [candidate division WOR-3 bacterium]
MKTFVLNVLGSDYKIKADRDGAYIYQVGKIVDEKMKQIHKQFPQGSLARTAVVSCINLVDEFLTKEQENEAKLKSRIYQLIEKLERVV